MLPNWSAFGLHPDLLRSIALLGFENPTPIQKECLPISTLFWKDVIGAAETVGARHACLLRNAHTFDFFLLLRAPAKLSLSDYPFCTSCSLMATLSSTLHSQP
jgi:hypothetical protein